MIELVIAALFQIATITADVTATPSAEDGAPTTTTTTTAVDGGTGNWDDGN